MCPFQVGLINQSLCSMEEKIAISKQPHLAYGKWQISNGAEFMFCNQNSKTSTNIKAKLQNLASFSIVHLFLLGGGIPQRC